MAKKKPSFFIILIMILAAIGGGAFYWFKFRKLKDKNGNTFELGGTATGSERNILVNGQINGSGTKLFLGEDGYVHTVSESGVDYYYLAGWKRA